MRGDEEHGPRGPARCRTRWCHGRSGRSNTWRAAAKNRSPAPSSREILETVFSDRPQEPARQKVGEEPFFPRMSRLAKWRDFTVGSWISFVRHLAHLVISFLGQLRRRPSEHHAEKKNKCFHLIPFACGKSAVLPKGSSPNLQHQQKSVNPIRLLTDAPPPFLISTAPSGLLVAGVWGRRPKDH